MTDARVAAAHAAYIQAITSNSNERKAMQAALKAADRAALTQTEEAAKVIFDDLFRSQAEKGTAAPLPWRPLMKQPDPAQMQPHELADELGLRLGHIADWSVEVKWMRICVALQREVRYLRGAIEAHGVAINNLQKGYYVGSPPNRTPR